MLRIEKEYGSLDGLDVSIDEVDIPLFLNSCDIFAASILGFSWASESYENKHHLSFKSLLGPLKLNKCPRHLLGHLRYNNKPFNFLLIRQLSSLPPATTPLGKSFHFPNQRGGKIEHFNYAKKSWNTTLEIGEIFK